MRAGAPHLELHPSYSWGPEIALSPAPSNSPMPSSRGPRLGICGAQFMLCDLENGQIHTPGLAANAVCPPVLDGRRDRILLADHEGIVALHSDGSAAHRLCERPFWPYDRERALAMGADPALERLPGEFDWFLQVDRAGRRIASQVTMPDGSHHLFVIDASGRPQLRFATGPAWLQGWIEDARMCLVGFRGGLSLVDLDRLDVNFSNKVPGSARSLEHGLRGTVTDCQLAPGAPMLVASNGRDLSWIRDLDSSTPHLEMLKPPELEFEGMASAWSPELDELWVASAARALWCMPMAGRGGVRRPLRVLGVESDKSEGSAAGGPGGSRPSFSACGRYLLVRLTGFRRQDASTLGTLTTGLPFGLGGVELSVAHGPRPVEFVVVLDRKLRRAQLLRGLPEGCAAWLMPDTSAGERHRDEGRRQAG